MSKLSLLESIYLGKLDERAFEKRSLELDFPKVSRLTEQYRDLLIEYPPHEIEAAGRVPDPVFHRLAAMGAFGASIPESYGGLGFNLREYLKVVEEMVKLDMAVALPSLAHLAIGVKGIELFGTDEQKKRYLPRAASGEMIFAFALTEPRIGSDAQHIETRATLSPDGEHYLLNGRKTYITNANYAGALTVFAQLDYRRPGWMGAFIVETSQEGVKVGKDMPKMGLKASSTASIQFKDVGIPRQNLLGKPGEGFKISMTILNYGRLALGAASVGMMRQSLEDMSRRASSRVQFGTPIKDFPLIQEKLAKARVNTFVSSAINDYAATLLQTNPRGNLAVETSHCKLFGTTRAWDTLYDAFQVAGGSAYLTSQPYEKRTRDFRVATVFEGTTEIHSFYPALSLLRNIERTMGEARLSKAARLLLLLRNAFKRTEWPLKFKDHTMEKASRLARKTAAAIRRRLFLGPLLHGRNVVQRQFYLRRITTLSVHLFGLLAVLATLRSDEQEGRLTREELDILAYFVAQVREMRKSSTTLFDSPLEQLSSRLMYPPSSIKQDEPFS
jgi:acyl-CoA dehydrogenase family member 9